ncbi:hypothetical protein HanXRQr2_Chr08g0319821 [Helianthus annuus]|uniref:Uncharacterized protein n=1 Tax=Helianthus annuus TaxID=4232 RepID=A0A9K3IBN9_HELAN|nr:hypothetical protein HanXRQr2_Chr08g0319821 [Helianthus annuus]
MVQSREKVVPSYSFSLQVRLSTTIYSMINLLQFQVSHNHLL